MGDIPQDGLQALARLAPVGIEVHDNGAWIAHLPIGRTIVGNDFLELLLCDGMDGIDGVHPLVICVIPLGTDTYRGHCHQQEKQYFFH